MTETQKAELTQKIVQICNVNVKTAEKLLSYCNWDVVAAINLKFSGFDINRIPESDSSAKVSIVQSLNHDLYSNFQEEAKKKNKWAIVFLKASSKDTDIFNRFSMYDFIDTRFHCLSLDPDDSSAKWFVDFYSISSSPCLAIINPSTGDLVDKLSNDLNSSRVTNFLKNFLSAHQEFGNSLDFDLNCTDPLINEDDLEMISMTNSTSSSSKKNDDNDKYTIVLEMMNKKRTHLLMDKNETAASLYKKVSSLFRIPISSFSLLKYPDIEIRNISSSIENLKLNGAYIRISIIQ